MNDANLPPALTDKELADTLGGAVHDHPITISGKCHLNAPLIVIFESKGPSLLLVCPACGSPVARVAVAKSEVH